MLRVALLSAPSPEAVAFPPRPGQSLHLGVTQGSGGAAVADGRSDGVLGLGLVQIAQDRIEDDN
jgi:hypothetical protein